MYFAQLTHCLMPSNSSCWEHDKRCNFKLCISFFKKLLTMELVNFKVLMPHYHMCVFSSEEKKRCDL